MRANGFTCDVCRTPKRDVNHWFMAEVKLIPQIKVTIFEWDAALEPDNRLKHLCGVECACRFMARELGQESLTFPRIQ